MMSILFIALGALATQSVPPPPPSPAYQAPPVRPFEPTGPVVAQGGEAATPAPRALDAPVTVDAYRGHYEGGPSEIELAYEQGVAQAEISMDSRMGPLDGAWTVAGADGAVLFTLVLADDGSGAPVEGAWRDGHGKLGVAASTAREDGRTVIVLDGRCELHLTRAGQGFTGVIVIDGREQAVRLLRA